MPWPCNRVRWKIHPLLSPGLAKALVGTTCAQGLQPCSDMGREEEVVPTLTPTKTRNCECGKGFPETAEKPRLP